MRKYLLSLTLLIGFSQASLAQFGKCTASEIQTYVDKVTGYNITMLTDTLKNDRFLYQTDPMWTADGKMKPDHAHPSFSPDGTKVVFQSGHFTNGKRLNLMMVDITSIK